MTTPIFTGSATAMCTPFTADNTINYDEFGRLIEFQIKNATDALVITGTTGEPSTMPDDEQIAVWRYAIKAIGGRVPAILGCGSNDTRHAVYLADQAANVGADALLVVTPYYNKTTPAGLVEHYRQIAQVGLPIILYNVPGRTGMNISPATLQRLCEIEQVVGLKEAAGDIKQLAEMVRLCGDRLAFYSGEDDIVVAAMAMGFVGVVSVAANLLPQQMHDLTAAFFAGDVAKARQLQLWINQLVGLLFCEVNPIPVKTALQLMGFEMGGLRAPLCEMQPENRQKLQSCMQRMGLL